MTTSTEKLTPEAAAARISGALDAIREELHPLENVVQAFRDLLVEKARLKAELAPPEDFSAQVPDPVRFSQGVPLASMGALMEAGQDAWTIAAQRLVPAMERGFPSLREELGIIHRALESGQLNPSRYLQAAAQGLDAEAEQMAVDLAVSPQSMQFVLEQIIKPLVERRAEVLGRLIQDLRWQKGYCPICGSMPELAFLIGEGGQRWLRCAFCAHEWRFVRLVCPFCENEEQDGLLHYYIAGRELERAEVCRKCRRYLVCIDVRGRLNEAVLDVAALGLVHLDMLTQEKGYLPATASAWNVAVPAQQPRLPRRHLHGKSYVTAE